jgi:heme-degrading monooxygenase HmoA
MTEERSRLVHMAVLTPREGRVEDLLASMRVMGEPADRHRGLRQHLIGRDRGTGRLVGITVWDSENDWSEAVGEGRAAIAQSRFDMDAILETGDAFVLDVVDVLDRSAGVQSRGELPPR